VTVAIREVRWEDFHPLVENYFSYYDELTDEPGLGLILFAEKPSLADEAAWFLGLYRSQLAGDQVALVAEVDGRPRAWSMSDGGFPIPRPATWVTWASRSIGTIEGRGSAPGSSGKRSDGAGAGSRWST